MPRSVDELAHRHIRENDHGNSMRRDYRSCALLHDAEVGDQSFKACKVSLGPRPLHTQLAPLNSYKY